MSDLRERLRGEAWEWLKTIGAAFVAYLAFTTVAFAQYRIPSESMVPHIEVGDRVTVSLHRDAALCCNPGHGPSCVLARDESRQ